MTLSDVSIRNRLRRGDLIIKPLNAGDIQSASVNFQLGYDFACYKPKLDVDTVVVAKQNNVEEFMDRFEAQWVVLEPGKLLLGTTMQKVRVPADLKIQIDARSYIARMGIQIHLSAGNVDPNWGGIEPAPLTLEIKNHAPVSIRLDAGLSIGQFVIEELDRPAERLYGNTKLGNKFYGSKGLEISTCKN